MANKRAPKARAIAVTLGPLFIPPMVTNRSLKTLNLLAFINLTKAMVHLTHREHQADHRGRVRPMVYRIDQRGRMRPMVYRADYRGRMRPMVYRADHKSGIRPMVQLTLLMNKGR